MRSQQGENIADNIRHLRRREVGISDPAGHVQALFFMSVCLGLAGFCSI